MKGTPDSCAPSVRSRGTEAAARYACTAARCEVDLADTMEVLDDKYELGQMLGNGGMGAVFAARHLITGRKVAVKRMRQDYARMPGACDRFLREARAASMIDHPNIVQIIDVGLCGGTTGSPYMVMEYLKGESVSTYFAREAPLSLDAVARVVLPVLDALAVAHGAGIVHRDVKPDNIYLAEVSGRKIPKLLDFGIARLERESNAVKLTGTGQVIGTPQYMAPEQAQGVGIDHRVDLYAMGVILYEGLSGRLPITADNYAAMLVAILQTDPVPLREVAPHVSPELAAVVHRAMARRSDDRFQTAQALTAALEEAMFGPDGNDLRATSPRGIAVPIELQPTAALPARSPMPPSREAALEAARGVSIDRAALLDTGAPRSRFGKRAAIAAAVLALAAALGGAAGFLSLDGQSVAPIATPSLPATEVPSPSSASAIEALPSIAPSVVQASPELGDTTSEPIEAAGNPVGRDEGPTTAAAPTEPAPVEAEPIATPEPQPEPRAGASERRSGRSSGSRRPTKLPFFE